MGWGVFNRIFPVHNKSSMLEFLGIIHKFVGIDYPLWVPDMVQFMVTQNGLNKWAPCVMAVSW